LGRPGTSPAGIPRWRKKVMRGMLKLLAAAAIAGLATLAQPQLAEAQRSNGNGQSDNSSSVVSRLTSRVWRSRLLMPITEAPASTALSTSSSL